jgi:hypothetical protein
MILEVSFSMSALMWFKTLLGIMLRPYDMSKGNFTGFWFGLGFSLTLNV